MTRRKVMLLKIIPNKTSHSYVTRINRNTSQIFNNIICDNELHTVNDSTRSDNKYES